MATRTRVPNPETPTRAVIYTRISDDRTGDEAGVTRQRKDCVKLCDDRGWTVVGEFEDNDISASDLARKKRPEYQEMKEWVAEGRVDVIVAWHVDRLYRSNAELEELIKLAAQVRIATCYGEFDLGTDDGQMQARILVAVAGNASAATRRRIRRKFEDWRRDGIAHPGPLPFGFVREGHGADAAYVVHPEQAKVVADLVRTALTGASIREMTIRLNADGVTPPPGAARWYPESVRRILRGPRLAGCRRDPETGELVELKNHAALIDKGTHERLVTKMEERPATGSATRRRVTWTGTLVCGGVLADGSPCGGTLYRTTNYKGTSWACRKRPGAKVCGRLGVAVGRIEPLLEEMLFQRVDSSAGLTQALHNAGSQDDAAVMDEIAELEHKLAMAAEGLADNQFDTFQDYSAYKRVLEARLRTARGRLSRSTGSRALVDLIGTSTPLRSRWPTLTRDQQRVIISALVDHVTVLPAENTRSPIEDRVRVTWLA
jgi:DNA invertase Pin-like site-specific DNA recombinase